MGFFAFLKANPKSSKKQMKSGSETLVVSTATTSSSNNETSRSAKSKSSVSISSQQSNSAMFKENARVFRGFKLAELRSATNDFDQTLKIGVGGFGNVYKGFLKPLDEKSSRFTVAVKINHRDRKVIYRDFKPSTVLLDGDFNPKLSDFGLAREGPAGNKTYVSTAVAGTFGYLEPEYMRTGHLSTKSDIWSFGVVLYELLTGRCSFKMNEECLLDWIKQFPIESKRFNMIVDPRLSYHYSMKTVREVAKLANRCLLMEAKERPKMGEVVGVLKQIVKMTEMASGGKVEGKRKGKRPEPSSS